MMNCVIKLKRKRENLDEELPSLVRKKVCFDSVCDQLFFVDEMGDGIEPFLDNAFGHRNYNDDQSTILSSLTGSTLFDDDFNFDDWNDDGLDIFSTIDIPEKKKRVSFNETLEFPRYFNKDDCPLACQRDAPSSKLTFEEDEEDIFGKEYMDTINEILLSTDNNNSI